MYVLAPRHGCSRVRSRSTSPHGRKIARRPISRVLSLSCDRGWPFIWDARHRTPRATDPGDDAGTRLPAEAGVPPLFGLAPGGVYRATSVAGGAVVSYTAVSPLPRISKPSQAWGSFGGLLSVALSLGLPPPGVTRHPVPVEPGLSSPDHARKSLARRGHPAIWHGSM